MMLCSEALGRLLLPPPLDTIGTNERITCRSPYIHSKDAGLIRTITTRVSRSHSISSIHYTIQRMDQLARGAAAAKGAADTGDGSWSRTNNPKMASHGTFETDVHSVELVPTAVCTEGMWRIDHPGAPTSCGPGPRFFIAMASHQFLGIHNGARFCAIPMHGRSASTGRITKGQNTQNHHRDEWSSVIKGPSISEGTYTAIG
ncbi:hypothetical protein F5Y09DRAFT_293792 [Xylaria sp. FL1042]|nr:hypothetical protein F5Y09DRAFT_293792 [Xylaria sp. FL1042]